MDKQLLEQEAEIKYPYPKTGQFGKYYYDVQRKAYIAGATSSSTVKNLEAENGRLKKLIEALYKSENYQKLSATEKEIFWHDYKRKNNL